MLTEITREHVESGWKSIPREQLKTARRRLRVQVVESLIDLAFVAEYEPEDQLRQMFTPQTFEPLLRALTGEGSGEITERHYQIAKLMLRVAHERLKPQIPKAFQTTINPLLDQNLLILEQLKIEPRKIPPTSIEERRERLRKKRQSILKKLYRNKSEKKPDADTK